MEKNEKNEQNVKSEQSVNNVKNVKNVNNVKKEQNEKNVKSEQSVSNIKNVKNEILLLQNKIKKYEQMVIDRSIMIGILKTEIEESKNLNRTNISNNLINKFLEIVNNNKQKIKKLLSEIKDLIDIINSLLIFFKTKNLEHYNKFNSSFKNINKISSQFSDLNKDLNKELNDI